MGTKSWQIDTSHSAVGFSVRHLVVSKVRGAFLRWGGRIEIDEAVPSRSSVEVRIEAGSIDTRDPKRDEHLRSVDFLEAERFPEIVYASRRVEDAGGGRLRVVGDLTIRGVTREVPLEVERTGRIRDPWGNDRLGFAARASVDRREFGLVWNVALEAGGVVVGDRLDVEIEVEAVRPAEAKAA